MMKGTTKGNLLSMKPRFLLLAIMAAAASVLIGGGIVLAQSKYEFIETSDEYVPFSAAAKKWNIPYKFELDPEYPPYAIALKAMLPIYTPSKYLERIEPNPVIGMAEIDLNYDRQDEIIAFPTEEYDRGTNFCNLGGLCPHYVIQIQGNKAQVLGVLYADKVNRGDRIVNKYLTLKVYNAPKKDKEYFEEYAYNPATNEYEPLKK